MKKFRYDTHAHIDLYKNPQQIIEYIEANNSYTIAVTNLPVLYKKYLLKYHSLKYVRFALGFHPELVFQYRDQLSLMLNSIKESKYIGEVGLDYVTKDSDNRHTQRFIFNKLVEECNNVGGKILSIHSRRAVKDIYAILGDTFNGKIILHWFSGSLSELNIAVDRGYYFSVNPDMFNSNNGKELIKNMPLDKILLESDAPFTQNTNKSYNLDFISSVETGISNIKALKENSVNLILKNNFKSLLY